MPWPDAAKEVQGGAHSGTVVPIVAALSAHEAKLEVKSLLFWLNRCDAARPLEVACATEQALLVHEECCWNASKR